MLAELRKKSQITIPREIIIKLGLSEGDKFEIYEKEGIIHLEPVEVYPKKYLKKPEEEIIEVKEKIESDEQPIFDNINEMLNFINNNEN